MIHFYYLLVLVWQVVFAIGFRTDYGTLKMEEDKNYWIGQASAKLDEVLNRSKENGIARNVIVFVGDGMGISTITAGRIYKGGESHVLSFEKFPATGLSKTYNVDNIVSDSASTGTSLFTGVKTTKHVVGLDITAEFDKCHPDKNERAHLTSFMTWAQESRKDTGIVTTMRITHDTPASTYAHVNNKRWECDAMVPPGQNNCIKDIARQLVEDAPGRNFKVILGGGRNEMGDSDNPRGAYCIRKDGKNLPAEWKKERRNAKYVTTADQLSRLDINNTDYLLGLFSPGHMNYTEEKEPTRPSLKLMTETAIRMLRKNKNGFALMVEGGLIDYAHHDNMARLALSELVDLEEAVEEAVRLTDPRDTLIIVTGDHSHTMTINGYPRRGSNILGLASNTSELFYETLTYANGRGYTDHRLTTKQNNCHEQCTEEMKESASVWRRPQKSERENIYHRHLASVYRVLETHAGEDVPIYASGPMSHLLIGVHEENYIASVISYAMCIGPQAYRCNERLALTKSEKVL